MRNIRLPPQRLERWLERFGESHGSLVIEPDEDGLRVTASDGAVAEMVPPWPVDGRPGTGNDPVQRLAALAAQPRRVAIILLRRGGYAVGLSSGGHLSASKCGTRYVQSRTAAGGWSQQRYARRRGNQADELVDAVAGHAIRVLLADDGSGYGPEYLALGGDRALCDQLLQHRELQPVRLLPRLAWLDVQDPRRDILEQAARDVASLQLRIRVPKP